MGLPPGFLFGTSTASYQIEGAATLDGKGAKGFNASINSMVDFADGQVREYLLEPSAAVFELVNRKRIVELFDLSPVPNHLSKFLFSFINARVFLEQFA